MSLLCKKRGSKLNKLSKNVTYITDIYSLLLSKGDSWLQLTHSSNDHSIEINMHTWCTRTQRKDTQNKTSKNKHAQTCTQKCTHVHTLAQAHLHICGYILFTYISFHNSERMCRPTKHSQTPLKVLVRNDTSSFCPFREHEWFKYTHTKTHRETIVAVVTEC